MAIASERMRVARDAWLKGGFILAANLAAVVLISCVLGLFAGADPFHPGPGGGSAGWAALVGWLHVSFGATAAAMRASARFVADSDEAADLRQEGSALLLGAAALIAAGASLIVLSMAGPGRPVLPFAGAVSAISLNALATILVTIRWRRLDELNRTAARDAGYLAIGWLTLFGGTWAILAHVGLVGAPTPLDWLTMMGGFSFVSGLVAFARKGGFASMPSASSHAAGALPGDS